MSPNPAMTTWLGTNTGHGHGHNRDVLNHDHFIYIYIYEAHKLIRAKTAGGY